jgi:hypothetical protein
MLPSANTLTNSASRKSGKSTPTDAVTKTARRKNWSRLNAGNANSTIASSIVIQPTTNVLDQSRGNVIALLKQQ